MAPLFIHHCHASIMLASRPAAALCTLVVLLLCCQARAASRARFLGQEQHQASAPAAELGSPVAEVNGVQMKVLVCLHLQQVAA
jgi:hypothetical protein